MESQDCHVTDAEYACKRGRNRRNEDCIHVMYLTCKAGTSTRNEDCIDAVYLARKRRRCLLAICQSYRRHRTKKWLLTSVEETKTAFLATEDDGIEYVGNDQCQRIKVRRTTKGKESDETNLNKR